MKGITGGQPDRSPSLAFVITSLDYGGAERQLVALGAGFRRRGWEVDVVTLIEPRALQNELKDVGIGIHSLGMRRGVPDTRAIARLAGHLKRLAPSVVHSHMVHANLLTRVARLLAPVPFLVSTAHSIIEGGRLLELGYRLTDPLCDLTTNVSPTGVERYEQRGLAAKGRIRYMPNGIDLASFKRRETLRAPLRESLGIPNGFVWLAVGRFDPVKAYGAMLSAFKEVAGGISTTLVIAGDGEQRSAMADLAADLGVADRVRFLGIRSDVQSLMNAADGYLLSSVWEGLPMVLLEAASSSLPIVATDVGGVREIVEHGVTGFVAPADDPGALAAAMRTLMDLPAEARNAMGAAGRERTVARFDIERVLDAWEELYEAGIAGAQGRPRRWRRVGREGAGS